MNCFKTCLILVLISFLTVANALTCPATGNTCLLDCKNSVQCENDVVDGSSKTEFSVNCSGQSGCRNATFTGLQGQNATDIVATCDGLGSCQYATFISKNSAVFECDGTGSCDGTTFQCLQGDCTLNCKNGCTANTIFKCAGGDAKCKVTCDGFNCNSAIQTQLVCENPPCSLSFDCARFSSTCPEVCSEEKPFYCSNGSCVADKDAQCPTACETDTVQNACNTLLTDSKNKCVDDGKVNEFQCQCDDARTFSKRNNAGQVVACTLVPCEQMPCGPAVNQCENVFVDKNEGLVGANCTCSDDYLPRKQVKFFNFKNGTLVTLDLTVGCNVDPSKTTLPPSTTSTTTTTTTTAATPGNNGPATSMSNNPNNTPATPPAPMTTTNANQVPDAADRGDQITLKFYPTSDCAEESSSKTYSTGCDDRTTPGMFSYFTCSSTGWCTSGGGTGTCGGFSPGQCAPTNNNNACVAFQGQYVKVVCNSAVFLQFNVLLMFGLCLFHLIRS